MAPPQPDTKSQWGFPSHTVHAAHRCAQFVDDGVTVWVAEHARLGPIVAIRGTYPNDHGLREACRVLTADDDLTIRQFREKDDEGSFIAWKVYDASTGPARHTSSVRRWTHRCALVAMVLLIILIVFVLQGATE